MSTSAKSTPKPRTKSKTAASTAKSATSAKTPKSAAPAEAPLSALDGAAPPPAKRAEAAVVESPKSVIMGPVMRRKQLVDAVVERSGTKKKIAKPVVEAALHVLAEALADNRELALPPLGRVKIRKERKLANARILTIKLRQSLGADKAKPEDMGEEGKADSD